MATKISEYDVAVSIEQDVLKLQVAVYNADAV
jgi:hypothetical protein